MSDTELMALMVYVLTPSPVLLLPLGEAQPHVQPPLPAITRVHLRLPCGHPDMLGPDAMSGLTRTLSEL
jgi:hypothetical protein